MNPVSERGGREEEPANLISAPTGDRIVVRVGHEMINKNNVASTKTII